MKKTFASLFVLFVAALPAVCASTCETRVDRHQDATTRQRVAHCLTPEAEPPAPAGPELVYYGVSSSKPQEEKAETAKRRKQMYFDKDGVAVSNDFVDTRQFPVFTNDTLSEQQRMALETAEKKQILQDSKAQEQDALAAKKEKTARAPRRLDTPAATNEAPVPAVISITPETASVSAPVAQAEPASPATATQKEILQRYASKPAAIAQEEEIYERPTDASSYTELVERAIVSPYGDEEYPDELVARPLPEIVPPVKPAPAKKETKTQEPAVAQTTEGETQVAQPQEEPLLEEPQVDPEQAAVYAALEEQRNYAARQQKPKRVMKEVAPQPQELAPAAAPADAYGDMQPVTPSYPTDTPPAELAQAQALENNPVSLPDPSAYSMPEDFTDDDLLTGNESFGYNATDPAMQP